MALGKDLKTLVGEPARPSLPSSTSILSALYGDQLEENLGRIRSYPVQMGFKFERVNNWGGFINRKVFLIHFSNNFEVEKIDFD